MIQLEVYGKPVPWAASRAGKFHHYDPKAKDKEQARWQIKAQYNDQPYAGAVHLDFTFFFPIPKGTSSVRKRQMLNHVLLPTVKPDTTNMQKLYEDCLKGIVIEDDNAVTDISSRKRYSENPRTLIRVIPLDTLIANKEPV